MMCFLSTLFALLSLLAVASTQVIYGAVEDAPRGVGTAIAVTGSDLTFVHGIIAPRQERETVTVTVTTIPAYCQSLASVPSDTAPTVPAILSLRPPQTPETGVATSIQNTMATGVSTLSGQDSESAAMTASSTGNPSTTVTPTTSEGGTITSSSTTQSASVTSSTMPTSTPLASGGSVARRPLAAAAGGVIIGLTFVILAG